MANTRVVSTTQRNGKIFRGMANAGGVVFTESDKPDGDLNMDRRPVSI
jgi:hypothetical protein